MLVQTYAHACLHTPGNAKEASQLIQPRTTECVVEFPWELHKRDCAVNHRRPMFSLSSMIALLLLPLLRVQSFEMYDPVPASGINYSTYNTVLQRLYDRAIRLEFSNNTHVFYSPDPPLPEPFRVVVEGGSYLGAWPETQPMAGAMMAPRDVRLALDNQLIFTRTQRSDGRIANVVFCGQVHSCHAKTCLPNGTLPPTNNGIPLLQGFYMASPMVDLSWYLNLSRPELARRYLGEVSTALTAFDAYLWNTRNDSTCFGLINGSINASSCPPVPSTNNRRGLLWSLGAGDAGEDGSAKYRNNTLPIQSMDMMAYSHDNRRSLARIARLLGNRSAERHWAEAAETVVNRTSRNLWRETLGAMFDRDVDDLWVTTLTHTNLRMMWHGMFTQRQADVFVGRHLMNRSEFFTNMPLTTVSIQDPRCIVKTGSAWTCAPEGLTLQRSVRALESYGHVAELTLVGRALFRALQIGCEDNITVGCRFPTAIDPFTAAPHRGDSYGNRTPHSPPALTLATQSHTLALTLTMGGGL